MWVGELVDFRPILFWCSKEALVSKEEDKVKLLGSMFLLMGMSSLAFGAAVPEVSSASAGSAIALISGALLVMRGRKK